nr:ATP synthase F1 subunit delta [Eubacterium sp.]
MAKLVSKVYGDALFSVALEENRLDEIWDEVKVLQDALTENGEFMDVMAHPEMTREKGLALIREAFADKLSDVMMGFLEVLVKKGRFSEIVSVLEHFQNETREYKRIGVVYVTTPTELTDAQKVSIVEKLTQTSGYETLEMNYVIDASLLGGIRIRIGDRIVDNSIQTKLEEMTRKLSKVRV